MTTLTAQFHNYRALFDDESATEIDWAKTSRNLKAIAYNITVAVGLALYLTFLAGKAIVSAALYIRSQWIKHEVTAKIQGDRHP